MKRIKRYVLDKRADGTVRGLVRIVKDKAKGELWAERYTEGAWVKAPALASYDVDPPLYRAGDAPSPRPSESISLALIRRSMPLGPGGYLADLSASLRIRRQVGAARPTVPEELGSSGGVPRRYRNGRAYCRAPRRRSSSKTREHEEWATNLTLNAFLGLVLGDDIVDIVVRAVDVAVGLDFPLYLRQQWELTLDGRLEIDIPVLWCNDLDGLDINVEDYLIRLDTFPNAAATLAEFLRARADGLAGVVQEGREHCRWRDR